MKILHQNCDPELANDRSLPYTSYLVQYKIDGSISYDLVITDKKSDIFDYYWDRYRNDLIGFKQSEGRTNPRLWGYSKKEEKKNGRPRQ
jgi:hypothetical protein